MESGSPAVRVVGRYALYDAIASGGMATVHVARLLGSSGFARTVAIKRLHPHLAQNPDFSVMFADEARLAARIHHPNVIPVVDVVARADELFLVMEYVRGETLSRLLVPGPASPPVIASVMAGALFGLHAAHEATSERGQPLGLVHRDISPQNILVGSDGTARVLDFGVAKALGRLQVTREGQVKGKLAYMAPEQLIGDLVDRRADIYACGLVLWEALVGAGAYAAVDGRELYRRISTEGLVPPSTLKPDIPREFDTIVMRAVSRDPAQRFPTAHEMAIALERCGLAPPSTVGAWVESVAGPALLARSRRVAEIEQEIEPELEDLPPELVVASPLPGASPSGRDELRTELSNPPQVGELAPETERTKRSLARWPAAAGALLLLLGAAVFGLRPLLGSASLAAQASSIAQVAPKAVEAGPSEALSPAFAPPDRANSPDGRPPPVDQADLNSSALPAPPPTAPVAAERVPHTAPQRVGKGSSGASRASAQTAGSQVPVPQGSCDPPFRRDPDGTKVFLPECFR